MPIRKYWYRKEAGHCADGDEIMLVPGSIDVVLNFIIVSLASLNFECCDSGILANDLIKPIPLLWKLRTTTLQKSVLTGVFICAGFVCIISIIRLVVLSRIENVDVTWNFVNSGIWSAAEPCMGVICACIPSLRPLVASLTHGTHRPPDMRGGKSAQAYTSNGSSGMIWRRKASENGKRFSRLEDPFAEQARWAREVTVKGGRDTELGSVENLSLQEINVPAGQIQVMEEIVITRDWLEYNDRVY
ncbi:MAG: hypothetical protein Q9178_004279 [Gyalolechia marmorata]